MPDAEQWDYIVIGAGSAGCASAYELLKAQPDRRVLVLEAGGPDRSPFLRVPAWAPQAMKRYDWGYRSQPDPTCNGATEGWTRGRVLGGSSSVNSTVFVRGAHRDFDRWALSSGGEARSSWSASNVMGIYRDIEHSDQTGPLRGVDGPLWVRTVKRPHKITTAFIQAAQACGYPFNADYNGERQGGVSYLQFSQRRGLRCSAADAFLKPLAGRCKNLQVRVNAYVEKIEVLEGRAASVLYKNKCVTHRASARHVIVSAGAINSPQLLMLSGIGDAEELRRHGIKPVIDLPGVGRNLQEHPSLRLLYKSRMPTHNLTRGIGQKLGIAAEFLLHREGPISNVFEAVGFLKTSASEPFEDVQIHFAAIGYFDTREKFTLAPYPSVSVVLNKSYPLGRGRIRLASGDPAAPPIIECRLLGDEADVVTLVRGLGAVRKIMRTAPLDGLIEEEVVAGEHVVGEKTMRDFVRAQTMTTYHPAGTCRMGSGPDAVVDYELRVRGTENLWIADASVMPDLISGNTNGVCMMIGAKFGRELAARG